MILASSRFLYVYYSIYHDIMSKEIKVKLDDGCYDRLMEFKRVFDHLMERETTMNNYLSLIIEAGMDNMLEHVMPKDTDVLWSTLKELNKEDPEFFSNFILKTIDKTSEDQKVEIKDKIDYYIR